MHTAPRSYRAAPLAISAPQSDRTIATGRGPAVFDRRKRVLLLRGRLNHLFDALRWQVDDTGLPTPQGIHIAGERAPSVEPFIALNRSLCSCSATRKTFQAAPFVWL